LPQYRPNLLRAWWPAALGILVITFESTDLFSSRNTGGILYRLLTRLFGEINVYDFLIFHHYLRKTGHFMAYGVLSLLLLRGWRATLSDSQAWLWRTARLAWLGTAFIASLDEWHQTYIPSRDGTVWDVLLDSVAALIFLWLASEWLRRSRAAEQIA
jgi:hypothetical protein